MLHRLPPFGTSPLRIQNTRKAIYSRSSVPIVPHCPVNGPSIRRTWLVVNPQPSPDDKPSCGAPPCTSKLIPGSGMSPYRLRSSTLPHRPSISHSAPFGNDSRRGFRTNLPGVYLSRSGISHSFGTNLCIKPAFCAARITGNLLNQPIS